MSDTTELVDEESRRLHEAAENILAHRMRAQGRAASGYTADEYAEACEEARARLAAGETGLVAGDRILDQAMKELGYTPPGETTVVTEHLLRGRMEQILQERGFSDGQPDLDGSSRAPEPERIDAMKQAIGEIGRPGEERKDLAAARADQRDLVLGAAIKQNVIASESHYEAWGRRYDEDPAGTIEELFAKGVDVPGITPPSAYRDPDYRAVAQKFSTTVDGVTYHSDEESLRLHMAAEKILADAGFPIGLTGELEYQADDYQRVAAVLYKVGVEHVDELIAEATRRTMKVLGNRKWTPAAYMGELDTAAYAVRARAAELESVTG
jgi:hypothetical protein